MCSRTIAECHEVKRAREFCAERDADDCKWQHQGNRAPSCQAERAETPECDGADLIVIGDEHGETDQCARKSVDCDAGQNERDDIGFAIDSRQTINNCRCESATDECKNLHTERDFA